MGVYEKIELLSKETSTEITSAERGKIGELAKEIWTIYLKELCNRPREAVEEIQKCSKDLEQVTGKIVELEKKENDEDIINELEQFKVEV